MSMLPILSGLGALAGGIGSATGANAPKQSGLYQSPVNTTNVINVGQGDNLNAIGSLISAIDAGNNNNGGYAGNGLGTNFLGSGVTANVAESASAGFSAGPVILIAAGVVFLIILRRKHA